MILPHLVRQRLVHPSQRLDVVGLLARGLFFSAARFDVLKIKLNLRSACLFLRHFLILCVDLFIWYFAVYLMNVVLRLHHGPISTSRVLFELEYLVGRRALVLLLAPWLFGAV